MTIPIFVISSRKNRARQLAPCASLFLSGIMLLTLPASAQNWIRGSVDFEAVEAQARQLAEEAYEPALTDAVPEWMQKLTYDQYRDIRFDPPQALWGDEPLRFRAMFFHPGYLFTRPVELYEITDSHRQKVRLSEDFFVYGPLIKEKGDLPPEVGFAGFRIHSPLNSPDFFDELIVFQGASYWRALGRGHRYGISARGVAVNTGLPDQPEEFPDFRSFWLAKPAPGDETLTVFALLDGPSITGAFAFEITPGEDTVVGVHCVLFARKAIARLGIAPMSSMFWFGENSRRRFDDFRPEVHDSDGLSLLTVLDDRIWRPASNDSGQLEFSFFADKNPRGFGLLQRDRRLESYEDEEANYHLRPSLWIEPLGDWGAGAVMLMEIPTAHELSDNLTAMWVPEGEIPAGARLEFRYKQHWTMASDPAEAGGLVDATRTGVHEWQPNQRTIVVEFAGEKLKHWPRSTPLEPVVEVVGSKASQVRIVAPVCQPLADGRWRLAFQIEPAENGASLSAIGPLDFRATLRAGDEFPAETWSYRLAP